MTKQRSRMLLFWVTMLVVGGGIGMLLIVRRPDDLMVRIAVVGPLIAGTVMLLASRRVFEPSVEVPSAARVAAERSARQVMRSAAATLVLMSAAFLVRDERVQLALLTFGAIVSIFSFFRFRKARCSSSS